MPPTPAMRWPAGLIVALLVFVPIAAGQETAAKVDYFKQVRPILSQHCYGCHGPDKETRKGGLRVDLRKEAFEDLDGEAIIWPGDLEKSLVWQRITHEKRRKIMPPPGAKNPLSKEQIEVLKQWIEQGADWPEHWAYQKPVKPEVPEADGDWARTPIDHFVMKRLDEAELKPAPAADRATLLRRLSFDLTGLPPTADELDAFLSDEKPGAYERVVDSLLASSRYGERQAQEWLDIARYADTNGFQRDGGREAWKWRDWVIKAFNENKSFDKFSIEQLAGDLLPDATLEQKIATGFNRNHPINTEAGEVPDEYRSVYVMDRLNTTATTWLGMTLACAQCHDHKYDPISQKDFYRFYAWFNQVEEKDNAMIGGGGGFGRNPRPSMPVPNPDQAPHLQVLERQIKELKERMKAADALSDAGQAAWEERAREFVGKDVKWETATPIGMLAHNGSILSREKDGSILASGEAPVRDSYDLAFKPGKRKIAAIRIEVLPDESQPLKASGRSNKGQFILSGLKLRLTSLSDSTDPPLVFVAKADADLNQEPSKERKTGDIYPGSIASSIVIDDDPKAAQANSFFRGRGRGWSIIGDERMERHEALLVPLETLDLNRSSVLRLTLQQQSRPFKTLIGRFRISYTDDERVRTLMLPAHGGVWSALGPFPAEDTDKAYATAFEPEKEIKKGLDLKKEYDQPKVKKPETGKRGGRGKAGAKSGSKPSEKADAKKKGAKPSEKKPSGKKPVTAKPGKKADAADTEKKPATAKKEAPKKKDVAKQKESKTSTGKPAGKPGKKGETAKAAKKPDAKKKPEPKPVKLKWKAERKWRDGRRIPLQVGTHAWYLTRKLHSTRARTVTLRFDGPPGVKAWLNGELIFEAAPKPETRGRSSSRFSRGSSASDEREVRVGLRAGESSLVVKAVFRKARERRQRRGSSSTPTPEAAAAEGAMSFQSQRRNQPRGSLTFNLEPEGDDVVNHEIVTALRNLPAKKDTPTLAIADGKGSAGSEDKKPTREARLRKKVRKFYRENHDTLGRILKDQLARLEREKRSLERKMPSTLVMKELPEKKMRKTHLFKRGDFKQKGEILTAAVPEILPSMPKDLPQNRLGLAKWLFSKDNPLTARVTVNRIWQQYFGKGLVRTPDDFGIRGAPPTHPALLDWLAMHFVESGWDLKALHKLIVMSATYRQDATATETTLERDPENDRLARGPRRRLSAEMIRDHALSVSGLLVEKIGGRSVRPYQPEGLWSSVSRGQRYRRDKGDEQYRRGLYVYWKRGVPYPSMLTFDAAKREICTVQRTETTTPLQALVLLNDPVYVEAARKLAERMLAEKKKDDAARLAWGFRLCTSDQPTKDEVAILDGLLKKQRAHYEKKPEEAKKLLAVGDSKPDAKTKPVELAAWTSVASALLNLDATIHR